MVSAALQRRVWMGNYDNMPIFPNIYVIFVANPGIGKSMSARIGGAKILKTFRYIDNAKVKAGIPQDCSVVLSALKEIISVQALS